MRLHVISDLHLEFKQFFESHFEDFEDRVPESDLVILAGDIGSNLSGLRFAQSLETPVIYVAGNHEYYGQALPHLTKRLEEQALQTSVQFLENRAVAIDSVRVLGCTLWTDFELLGDREQAMQKAEESMNDFRRIRKSPEFHRLRPEKVWRLHRDSLEWLERTLESPFNGETIVVTHHAPSPRSLGEFFRTDPLAPAFASDLEWLLEKYKIDIWVHGHTHRSVDYYLDGTRILSNQCGYPGEPTGFNPDLLVTI